MQLQNVTLHRDYLGTAHYKANDESSREIYMDNGFKLGANTC